MVYGVRRRILSLGLKVRVVSGALAWGFRIHGALHRAHLCRLAGIFGFGVLRDHQSYLNPKPLTLHSEPKP